MGVLTQKMDRLCGFKLVFSSKPCYVNSNLSEVSQVTFSRPITIILQILFTFLFLQIVPENFHNVSTAPKDVGPPPPHKPPVDVAVFSKVCFVFDHV